MKTQLRIGGTRLVSTGRNIVRGDRYDNASYRLPGGRIVLVETLCEMEFPPKRAVTRERVESDSERDRR
jgi:hypothetical protein